MAHEPHPLEEVLDAHLPALLNHLWDAMEPTERKAREDLTPVELAIRLAYSDAHWIAKKAARLKETRGSMPHAHCPECLGAIGTHRTTCSRADGRA